MNIERPIAPEKTSNALTDKLSGFSTTDIRRLAMLGLPVLVILVSIGLYASSGRYIDTDNAYVKASWASVSPGISGDVAEVYVKENTPVKKDQPILRLASDIYLVGVEAAKAQVETAKTTVESDRAQYRQRVESLSMAETDVSFAERELKRQSALAKTNNVSQAKLDDSKRAYEAALHKIEVLKQERAEFLAKLHGNPNIAVEEHPTYQSAVAGLAGAEYLLSRSVVKAPFDGVVSHLPKAGDYGRTGMSLFTIVVASHIWIDANFKETEMTYMHPGQPAEIRVDSYPGRVFKGHIESIAQSSGSEFALLPAQNSTGNWIKVVQRIPMRIAVDDQDVEGTPVLRSGMSVNATVDTGHRRISRWFGSGA